MEHRHIRSAPCHKLQLQNRRPQSCYKDHTEKLGFKRRWQFFFCGGQDEWKAQLVEVSNFRAQGITLLPSFPTLNSSTSPHYSPKGSECPCTQDSTPAETHSMMHTYTSAHTALAVVHTSALLPTCSQLPLLMLMKLCHLRNGSKTAKHKQTRPKRRRPSSAHSPHPQWPGS